MEAICWQLYAKQACTPSCRSYNHCTFALQRHKCCLVQPNIEKKDNQEDWRNREAATFAFSSILEGPSYASLAAVVNAGLGFLLNATKDPNPMVRQTTAWTIGTSHYL